MELEKLEEIRATIEKETIKNVIKTISVEDSYLYAKMLITKCSMVADPFQNKIKAIIIINLFNSREFSNDRMSNSKRTLEPKTIRSEIALDDMSLIEQKEDVMLLIYEEVAKEIAADLFRENAENIIMQTKEYNRIFI